MASPDYGPVPDDSASRHLTLGISTILVSVIRSEGVGGTGPYVSLAIPTIKSDFNYLI